MFVRIPLTRRRSFVPVSMWRRRTLRGNVNVKFEDKTAAQLKGRFIKHGERKRRADLAAKKKKKKKNVRCEKQKKSKKMIPLGKLTHIHRFEINQGRKLRNFIDHWINILKSEFNWSTSKLYAIFLDSNERIRMWSIAPTSPSFFRLCQGHIFRGCYVAGKVPHLREKQIQDGQLSITGERMCTKYW